MGVGAVRPALGLVGAGSLARALVDGWLAAGWTPGQLWVTNRSDGERLRQMGDAGLRATRDRSELLAAVDVVVLLCKPDAAKEALGQLAAHWQPRHLLLSCLAGVPTAFLEQGLCVPEPRVVRAMPNIAAAVRGSATAFTPGRHARPADLEVAATLLGAMGDAWPVAEEAMDAVTAVAGSGPAYVFRFLEALERAALAVGLPGELARPLALRTVEGAARLAWHDPRPPAELRAAVSSPGGTTLAGLTALDEGGLDGMVREAVARARARGAEMGKRWAGAAPSERPPQS